ncbi:MAG: 1-(5-phosphoribosyl)-5-[(5-phosphoribosylamino)methylideneamino]imidazole-4-carboxamide isomerase [Planctomycetota bacterium]
MIVIPAIDLRDGKCVRLIQGQYHRQITYKDNPAEQARDFRDAGAEWLHVVDLDGALVGRVVNIEAIKSIVDASGINVEVGGGIREEKSIRQMLEVGVGRVIIGTKAVSDFGWFKSMAEKFVGKLGLGLDARGSKVATHGWTQDTPHDLLEFAAEAAKLPLAVIIYTDIDKDGMLSGPNFERTKALIESVDVPVVASGGVTELDDILKLRQLDPYGVIIGRALYEGSFTLVEAIAAAKTG